MTGQKRGSALLDLAEVQRQLRITGQSYAGVHPIDITRIVGSVDRTSDFDRRFRPRRRQSRQRLATLRAAFPDGTVPPIQVYQVGSIYFVVDGHHRIALAYEQSAAYIDAEIIRLHTDYDSSIDS